MDGEETNVDVGVAGAELDDDDLIRELGELHRTRHDTLRHGSAQALEHHNERLAELEGEYLRRFPDREVDPNRLRQGARSRTAKIQALEETPQVARAVDDEVGVPDLAVDGSPARAAVEPLFREPTPPA